MNNKTLPILAFFFLSICQITFAQTKQTQIFLKAEFYTKSEFKNLLKDNVWQNKLKFRRDSMNVENAKIFFMQDDTFYYRFIFEVHLANGEVGYLTVPFSQTGIGKSYNYIKNSFKTEAKNKTWLFQVRLSNEDMMMAHTDFNFLAVPPKDSPEVFIYTFTSTDMGKTWDIDLTIEEK